MVQVREARQGYVSLAMGAMHAAQEGGLKDTDELYDGTQVSSHYYDRALAITGSFTAPRVGC